MPYEILSHTADLRLKIQASSLKELFGEALLAVADVLSEKRKTGKPIIRKVSVSAQDKTSLLVDFLNEVLAMSQINKEVYTKVNFLDFSETRLEAEIEGFKVGGFDEDIKAITYHEAEIKQNKESQWETVLVFDI
ncbi:MAG: archease [Candidatus Pacebacteria bacterium]|nr:archease [Candidatus Paceibacterota bacterium]NUQ57365.1 archease [Candidatus Paceibacter sp.]